MTNINEPKFEMSAMQTEVNIIGICKLLILINLFLEISRLHPSFSLQASKKSLSFG